jgi:CubicO group peptidase (beta-lactamase class C family)
MRERRAPRRRIAAVAAGAVAALASSPDPKEAPSMATVALPRSAPEAHGIPSHALTAFLDAAEGDVRHLHGLVVLRRGHVVSEGYWEPYGPAIPHMLFSLSKSFTSTAVGMLVGEGRLSVDDHVLDFFPGQAPAAPSPRLRAMRVRHLLTMTTGQDADPTRPIRQANVDWVRAFLDAPLPYEPGERFVYNSGATYMLSAIAQKITGQRLLHYLGPRLFAPLGIESPTWETSPQGVDAGGWGLKARTADVARFGQLYLQKGAWRGRQLVPAEWVAAATAPQVPNGPSGSPDWEQGYGYQFWRCRHGAYRGDGAHGQFCLVLPEQEAVVAITGGVGDMQRVLDLVWEHLLPAFGGSPPGWPADPVAAAALAARLAGLRLPTPTGASTSPLAAALAGRTFVVEPNEDSIESVAFEDGADGVALVVRNDHGEQRVRVGYGEWARGALALGGPAAAAAAGAWADERTFLLHLWWVETPWRMAWTCRFEGDRLRIERETNVALQGSLPAALEARAATPVA